MWTCNAPREITGDSYGNRESFQADTLSGNTAAATRFSPSELGMQQQDDGGRKFSIEEKRERAIGYFSALADLEELRGGITHFRVMLTVGAKVTNRQLRLMTNAFLGENFPLAEALIAIHRNTLHTHVHIYAHARQLDNRRIHLGQRYFHLDESWIRVCAEHLGDRKIYEQHMELKAITLEWKERAKEAREKGESIPPKDDRWGDHHDTRLSFRPWDDSWCGRLMAQMRVAELKVEYLTVTKAKKKEITSASREAEELRERLDSVVEKRRTTGRSDAKRRMPAEIITVSEARALTVYNQAIEERSKEFQPRSIAPVAAAPRAQAQSEQRDLVQGVLGFKDPPDLSDAGAAEVSPKLLTNEEVCDLAVNLELARAKVIALRTEEQDFKESPHQWPSSTHHVSLSEIEERIVERVKQRSGIDTSTRLKEKCSLSYRKSMFVCLKRGLKQKLR